MLFQQEEIKMESTYKVIQLIGSSSESWEKAASNAIKKAAKSLRDLRIAEVVEMDLQIEDDKVVAYRTKLKISFKFEDWTGIPGFIQPPVGIKIYPATSLTPPEDHDINLVATDFAEIKGQEHIKRALEMASVEAHNNHM